MVLADARPAIAMIRVSERDSRSERSDAGIFEARNSTPRVLDNLLGDDRAVSQDDRDCHEAHDGPGVSLDGAGLTAEGLAAQKHDNFFLEPVQTVPL